MFGKVRSLMAQGHRAVKSGLAWAHGMYAHGLHLAGKVNDANQVGKRIAAIALPHMGRYLSGAEHHAMRAIGHVDASRGAAVSRFEDVQEKMRDHGRVWQQIRDRVPEARPYMA